MADPSNNPHTLIEIWAQIGSNVKILGLAGAAGAVFRALFAPEGEIKRRIVQGLAGALSAVFLGGVLAHLVMPFVAHEVYAYLASGFIMGSGGEIAVKAMQEKLYGKK